MAAALYTSRNDSPAALHSAVFPHAIISELDFHDNRYPSLGSRGQFQPESQAGLTPSDNMPRTASIDDASPRSAGPSVERSSMFIQASEAPARPASKGASEGQSLHAPSRPSSNEPSRSSVSYSLPSAAPRRVVERYSLDDNTPSQQGSSSDTRLTATQDPNTLAAPQHSPGRYLSANPVSSPRHPALPAAGVGTPTAASNPSTFSPPIMPLSASPTYNPPISPRPRAYAQQPKFINQTPPANAVNPVYSQNPPPQEEVCIECAMRDQDMADVDVTSPGVWDRESDVLYEELKRREAEEKATGIINSDEPPRPRARGDVLTEQNLKMWLSVNPREPTSRQHTLHNYLKSQRALLEAEAFAYARAMQEAKQLDNRMRDAYSQLRRSAYDMGNSAMPSDDTGGVRIRPPKSPVVQTRERSHSRDVTLLENGMIVEHVDVRKEEREARERRKREERRARKSSRSSVIDATSLLSAGSFSPQNDGFGPHTRYSQPNSSRPMSVLTAPLDRPDIPRAYSQASFSDIHSLGSGSPRRSVFFPAKMWKDGVRSQDSLALSGMSGSMVDMHVALQRDAARSGKATMTRRSQYWGPHENELGQTDSRQSKLSEEKARKKKKGLIKFWQLITRSNKPDIGTREAARSDERTDDDLPLAPPPPLSYLVNRGPGHASTPSLVSSSNPRFAASTSASGMSPPTAPSSILPSPTSTRPPDIDIAMERKLIGNDDSELNDESTIGKAQASSFRNVHSVISEPDMRQRLSDGSTTSPLHNATLPPVPTLSVRPPMSVSREKSLPPLPGEQPSLRPFPPSDVRPQSAYALDSRQLPAGSAPAHNFLPQTVSYRSFDGRRQSFGGLVSRPNFDTMPQAGVNGYQMPYGQPYDDFGSSRRSLHGAALRDPASLHSTPHKRKSRFSFATLLGKKQQQQQQQQREKEYGVQTPPQSAMLAYNGPDGQDEAVTANGYATSTSRHSAISSGFGTRMSVTSRRGLEELVAQDPEFVAYRYPSSDQRLDLLR